MGVASGEDGLERGAEGRPGGGRAVLEGQAGSAGLEAGREGGVVTPGEPGSAGEHWNTTGLGCIL